MGTDSLKLKPSSGKGEARGKKGAFPGPKTLIFACFFLYTAMMAAKGVFLAEVTYIMKIFEVDKATASLTNTYYFVAYAGMQVLLFFFVKKIDLRKFLVFTVPVAAVATIAMGFSRNITDMWVIFSICGLFQAGVYCGTNNTLTRYLPSEYLSMANRVMNLGYAMGTVIAYTVSAAFIKYGHWSKPFYIMGALFLFAIGFYALCAFRLSDTRKSGEEARETKTKTDAEEEAPLFTLETTKKKVVFYAVDLLLVFLITTLYYAIMNWITTLLVDVHELSQDISIYITILAPSLIAFGPMMTIRSCDKDKNFVRVGIKYMLFVLPIPLVLAFVYDLNALLAFVLSVAYVIGVNGVKAIVLSIIAFKMRTVINTAEYTSISNAVASLAGGIAPTVIGKIIDTLGWASSYFVVFLTGVAVLLAIVFVDLILMRAKRRKKIT